MPNTGENCDLRSRILSALNAATTRNAQFLSLAFPRLPSAAFEALTCAPNSELRFFFENAERGIAVAAFSSAHVAETTFPPTSFSELENLFPKKRFAVSLDADPLASVPAPKIFVVGNFENAEKNFAIIPVWQISREENFSQISAHIALGQEPAERLANALAEDFSHFKKLAETPHAPEPAPTVLATGEVCGDWYFSRGVPAAMEKIDAGEFQKIVLARAKDFLISDEKNFPAGTLISSLRNRFLSSACTIFFANDGKEKSIAGGSPEVLARLTGTRFETEALAGTASANAHAEDFLSDEKELREHRFVVDFIEEKLRALGLSPQIRREPETRKLPNVIHLRTPISAEIPTKNSDKNSKKPTIGEIVAALHPTPAMCGVPAEASKRFIAENEPFPRGAFSSPVGFVDSNGDGFFAVAIRCAIFHGKKIRLFAGAGLVRGSRAAKEASEIDAKISALRSILVP